MKNLNTLSGWFAYDSQSDTYSEVEDLRIVQLHLDENDQPVITAEIQAYVEE